LKDIDYETQGDVDAAIDNHPTIAILLCTMQGQSYLPEQLESILWQTYKFWTIWASDDGSSDGTHSILADYQRRLGEGRLSIHSGPAEGFVANFLSLTCNAKISANYYAFADQDDVWEQDKLLRAVQWLGTIPVHTPALYCSRTCNVDVNNQCIGYSRLFLKRPSFANALVQSIGGGNTMVFNDAARNLLHAAGADVNVVAHDWWAYLVVSGHGGQVFYDARPNVRYRQHGANRGWGQTTALPIVLRVQNCFLAAGSKYGTTRTSRRWKGYVSNLRLKINKNLINFPGLAAVLSFQG